MFPATKPNNQSLIQGPKNCPLTACAGGTYICTQTLKKNKIWIVNSYLAYFLIHKKGEKVQNSSHKNYPMTVHINI